VCKAFVCVTITMTCRETSKLLEALNMDFSGKLASGTNIVVADYCVKLLFLLRGKNINWADSTQLVPPLHITIRGMFVLKMIKINR
jgi:hypothetical protein